MRMTSSIVTSGRRRGPADIRVPAAHGRRGQVPAAPCSCYNRRGVVAVSCSAWSVWVRVSRCITLIAPLSTTFHDAWHALARALVALPVGPRPALGTIGRLQRLQTRVHSRSLRSIINWGYSEALTNASHASSSLDPLNPSAPSPTSVALK